MCDIFELHPIFPPRQLANVSLFSMQVLVLPNLCSQLVVRSLSLQRILEILEFWYLSPHAAHVLEYVPRTNVQHASLRSTVYELAHTDFRQIL